MTREADDTLDPITLTVVWNGLEHACNDIGQALQRIAHSEIVRDAGDCAAAVFDAHGRCIAQGVYSPGLLGPMTYIVHRVLEHVPVQELGPGDAILTNDIYFGAGHLPDAFTVTPVYDDAQELLGFVGSSVHLMDVGGASPGSLGVTGIIDNYQEGLRIAPVRHWRRGEPDPAVLGMIANNVRVPDKVVGDLHAMIAANNFGATRLREFFAAHGRATMEACYERILDDSELRTRAAIGRVPDGTFSHEDRLDDYGPGTDPVRLAVDVTIDGDALVVDWSRCDGQVPAGMNSSRAYSLAYSAFTVKALICPEVPMNEGALRPIGFVAPEGSFMNPRPPAPGGGRALTAQRHFETVAGALSQALPDRAVAAVGQMCNTVAGGTDEAGRPYLLWDMLIGGYPASASKDGSEGLCAVLNCRNMPVEVSELAAPVIVERLELVEDSGGAGTHRGACAIRKDLRFLGVDNRVTSITDRHVFPPPGVSGGGDGACGRIVVDPEGAARPVHSKAIHDVEQAAVVRFEVSGAGGFGDPRRRDPGRVADDVRDGLVSRAAANEQYGVVLDDDLSVDVSATEHARAASIARSGSQRVDAGSAPR